MVEHQNSQKSEKSKFCSDTRAHMIPRSVSSSRALDCAQDTLILMKFRAVRPENELFFGFVVDPCFMVLRRLTCNCLLYESTPAETMVDGLPRARSFGSPRFVVEHQNSQKSEKSRFRSDTHNHTIPRSLSSSRALDCARDTPTLL